MQRNVTLTNDMAFEKMSVDVSSCFSTAFDIDHAFFWINLRRIFLPYEDALGALHYN